MVRLWSGRGSEDDCLDSTGFVLLKAFLQGLLFGLCKWGFKVSSGTVERYRSSDATDFDISEIATSDLYQEQTDGFRALLLKELLLGSTV